MRKIFSAADIKGCMEKVQSVKYAEEACYNGSLTIKALSSACNDVDGEKNNFPPATDCSYSRELMIFETWNMRNDIGSCSETISESWLDSDEYIKEMETVSSICSCALETISDGGSVLIAIGRPGVMLQLLEDMSLSLESSNLKIIFHDQFSSLWLDKFSDLYVDLTVKFPDASSFHTMVPIYFVSSMAEELLEFFNIIPEFLFCAWAAIQSRSAVKREKTLGISCNTFIEIPNKLAGSLHSILSSLEFATWACGPSPSTLVSRSQLIAYYGGYDINLAFLPFKPMSMKYGLCSFISGMKTTIGIKSQFLEGSVREKTKKRKTCVKVNIVMASNNFSIPSPPIFSGENYPVWAIKMRTYLRAYDLWQVVEVGGEEAWDKLKEEFHGSNKIRKIEVINLRREFEILKMNDSETIEEFSNKLMKVVNQIRLMGEELTDSRILEKVLVSLPERFEVKISSLEDSKDLTKLSPSELVHAL
ncbi:hypothetical protein FXO38_25261 [Capsicum annuum]|nr:hypothetical protein FXO38_25261 [Capsicum annuum]